MRGTYNCVSVNDYRNPPEIQSFLVLLSIQDAARSRPSLGPSSPRSSSYLLKQVNLPGVRFHFLLPLPSIVPSPLLVFNKHLLCPETPTNMTLPPPAPKLHSRSTFLRMYQASPRRSLMPFPSRSAARYVTWDTWQEAKTDLVSNRSLPWTHCTLLGQLFTDLSPSFLIDQNKLP